MRIKSIFLFLTAFAMSALVVSCSSGDEYSSPLKNKTMSDILLDATATSNTINFADADLSKISVRSSES